MCWCREDRVDGRRLWEVSNEKNTTAAGKVKEARDASREEQ